MKQRKLFVRIVCVVLAALMALSVLMMALPAARAASPSAEQETEAVFRRPHSEAELLNRGDREFYV